MRETDADRIQAVLERASHPETEFAAEVSDIASRIDHTLLRPEATQDQILQLCDEGLRHGFAAVCVQPARVKAAADRLRGSKIKVAAVTGFPLGASLLEVKILEAARALGDGALEIDMVQNIGFLKDGALDLLRREVETVAAICAREGAILKIILETCLRAMRKIRRPGSRGGRG
jgi:deoxyribose-phosphate aldolase